jgi:hypothetical protein
VSGPRFELSTSQYMYGGLKLLRSAQFRLDLLEMFDNTEYTSLTEQRLLNTVVYMEITCRNVTDYLRGPESLKS